VTVKSLFLVCVVTIAFTVTPVFAEGGQTADALSSQQRAAITLAQAEGEQKAGPIALRLASVVTRLYENNLSEAPDVAVRTTLDAEMKDLVWQLLMVKGESMWAAVRALTPEQRQMLRDQIPKPNAGGNVPDLMDLISHTFHLADKKD
jgi:hypothetical protein